MLTVSATTTASLNLREGPGTNYPSLLVIPAGAAVSVQNAQYDGSATNWFPVTYAGNSGWCSGAYLRSQGRAAVTARFTEQAMLDSLFRHYGEPYIWSWNDCSQFVVDRWTDGGYYPQDGFLDAEANQMFQNFRSGRWESIEQDPGDPAMLAIACYVHLDNPDVAGHVQFVLNARYGITARGGGRGTTTPKPGAEVAVAPLNYRPDIYTIGGIYLPKYRFR